MNRFSSKIITTLFLCFLFTSLESIVAQHLTVILTRHVEKSTDDPRDPNLSDVGYKHAEALMGLFKNQKIDRFFSTPYKRTTLTIQPLATLNGKEIGSYSPAQQALFVEELKKISNETVVVAGHSNTIPELLNLLLGTKKFTQIDDARYGDAWVVTLSKSSVSVIQLKY